MWAQTRDENMKWKWKTRIIFFINIWYGLSACVWPSCKSVYGSLDSYWKRLNKNLTDILTFCTMGKYTHMHPLEIHLIGPCEWLSQNFHEPAVLTGLSPFVYEILCRDQSNIKSLNNIKCQFVVYLRWLTCALLVTNSSNEHTNTQQLHWWPHMYILWAPILGFSTKIWVNNKCIRRRNALSHTHK